MKKLIILALLPISIIAKAQTSTDTLPVKSGKIVYERTETAAGKSQNELFDKAQKWMLDNFSQTRAIQTANRLQGQLTGNGYFKISLKSGLFSSADYQYNFAVKINCKDGQYALQIYNITFAKDNEDAMLSNKQIPLENYNAQLMKSNNKSATENINTINYHLINVFFTLRDAINDSPELHMPSSQKNAPPAAHISLAQESAWMDLITRTRFHHPFYVMYETPDNEPIELISTVDRTIGPSTNIIFNIKRPIAESADRPVRVIFLDGSQLDFTSKTYWTKKGSSFLYHCQVKLDSAQIQSLKQKQIVKLQIAETTAPVNNNLSLKVMVWMQYLDALKPKRY